MAWNSSSVMTPFSLSSKRFSNSWVIELSGFFDCTDLTKPTMENGIAYIIPINPHPADAGMFDYSAQTEPPIPRQSEPLVLREKE